MFQLKRQDGKLRVYMIRGGPYKLLTTQCRPKFWTPRKTPGFGGQGCSVSANSCVGIADAVRESRHFHIGSVKRIIRAFGSTTALWVDFPLACVQEAQEAQALGL